VQQIEHLDSSKTAEILDMLRLPVAAAIARLGKRGFLDHMIKPQQRQSILPAFFSNFANDA
jgi:hypothetical protein